VGVVLEPARAGALGREVRERNLVKQKTEQFCTCGMMEVSLKKTGFDEVLK
jgi:hypothetical protein